MEALKSFKFCTPSNWINKNLTIKVIGVGGTGSEVLGCLARINYAIKELGHNGIHVIAFDDDLVERPNVGRQAFYPADIGHNKAITTVGRINILYGFGWEAKPVKFDPHEKPNYSNDADLYVTCVDKAQFRADFAKKLRENSTYNHKYWIDTGNGSHTGQVIFGVVKGQEPTHMPTVFDFHPELDGMIDNDQPSCSMEEALSNQDLPINRSIANAVMQIVWSLLRHGGTNHQGCYIDIQKGTQVPINIF
ncbi:PRTRC system ThiF family protein [Methylomonas sp. AM2-LC]|uniref:PRTRC system ThiF family protein n=1 Tax=Methylomonas sp. AM2-LC TaxID=3153301 RepID=UPI00326652F5